MENPIDTNDVDAPVGPNPFGEIEEPTEGPSPFAPLEGQEDYTPITPNLPPSQKKGITQRLKMAHDALDKPKDIGQIASEIEVHGETVARQDVTIAAKEKYHEQNLEVIQNVVAHPEFVKNPESFAAALEEATQDPPEDPALVEKLFASQVIKEGTKDTQLDTDMSAVAPDVQSGLDTAVADMIASEQWLQDFRTKKQQELNVHYGRGPDESANIFTAATYSELFDIVKSGFPGYQQWAARAPSEMWAGGKPWDQTAGQWNDTRAEAELIRTMSTEELQEYIPKRYDEILQAGLLPGSGYMENYHSANIWLDKMVAFGITEEHLGKIMHLAEIGTGAVATGVARAVAKGGITAVSKVGAKASDIAGTTQIVTDYGHALKDAARAAIGSVDQNPAKFAAEMGDIETAVKRSVSEIFEEGAINDPKIAESLLPSYGNYHRWVEPSNDLSMEAKRRFVQAMAEDSSGAIEALVGGLKIERLSDITPEVQGKIYAQIKKTHARKYNDELDSILDVEPFFDNVSSTYKARTIIGRTDGTLFESREEALNQIALAGYKRAEVQSQGTRFKIQVMSDVSEVDGVMRNVPIPTEARTPTSTIRTLFQKLGANYIPSSAGLVSKETHKDMLTALTGQNNLAANLEPLAKRIQSLSRGNRKRLRAFIDNDRIHETKHIVDGKEKILVGRWAKTAAEFEDRWFNQTGRRPGEAVYQAYYDLMQLNDFDFAIKNLGLYKGKVREGLENFLVTLPSKQSGEPFETGPVALEGKLIDEIPWDESAEAGILGLDDLGNPHFTLKNANRAETREMVANLQREGYKILQVSPMGRKNLMKNQAVKATAGDENVHFVVLKQYEVEPLGYQQIPYKEGLHIKYEDGFYVGSPKVKRHSRDGTVKYEYTKDQNIFHFTNRAKAEKVAGHLEHVRLGLKEGKDMDDYIRAHFNKPVRMIKGMFEEQIDPDTGRVMKEAFLDIDQTISARGTDERLGDIQKLAERYGNDFLDAKDDPYNLYGGLDLEYTGERNKVLDTVDDVGSEASPYFQERQASLVDAGATMNRALHNVIQSRFYDDLKIKEANKFVEEFGHLTTTPIAELRRNPIKHMMDPQWKETGVDEGALVAAKGANMALRNFMGRSTRTGHSLKWLKHKLGDSLYKSLGDSRAFELLEPMLLSSSKDPTKVLRSLAFHTKLGLFNPVQFTLQASSFAHVAALTGMDAAPAFSAYTLQRYLGFNSTKQFQDDIARHATKLGWKKEHFLEATRGMRETGFDRIGGEHAYRNDYFEVKLTQSAAGRFLDFGTAFFTEGEQLVRMTAWNGAYRQWRKANPTKIFDNRAKQEVLGRADLYSVNMTAASNAQWQRGLMSIPTQFWAYQARLMDQLLGKRLTGKEKARVMATYGILYGFPTSIAAGAGLAPVGDIVKTHLEAEGIPYDENVVTQGLVNGWLQVLTELGTGARLDWSRYGPGGLTAPWDFLIGEIDGTELLHGVSGTVFGDMFARAAPLGTDLWNTLTGAPPSIEVVKSNLHNFFQVAGTYANATRMTLGLKMGRYMSKNGTDMGKLSSLESMTQFFGGLAPEELSKTFRKSKILQAERDATEAAIKEAQKWLKKSYLEKDPKVAQGYREAAAPWMAVLEGDTQALMRVTNGALDEKTPFDVSTQEKWLKKNRRFEDDIRKQIEERGN